MNEKLCTGCWEIKPLSDFHRNKSRLDGRGYRCAPCVQKYEKTLRRQLVSKASNSAWYQKNKTKDPEKWRNKYWVQYIKKLYGLTPQDFDKIFDSQKGRCAICRVHQDSLKVRLAIDHCHKSKKVRGLLCRNCNAGIALLVEKKGNFLAAIKYLKL